MSHKDKPNYLKNYRPVLFYFCDSYDLTRQDIELLFFVYNLRTFTLNYLEKNYRVSNSYLYNKFRRLISKKFIYKVKNHSPNNPDIYCISQQGKLLVTRFYRILHGDEYFPRGEIS